MEFPVSAASVTVCLTREEEEVTVSVSNLQRLGLGSSLCKYRKTNNKVCAVGGKIEGKQSLEASGEGKQDLEDKSRVD